jgi:hypothetical protein
VNLRAGALGIGVLLKFAGLAATCIVVEVGFIVMVVGLAIITTALWQWSSQQPPDAGNTSDAQE